VAWGKGGTMKRRNIEEIKAIFKEMGIDPDHTRQTNERMYSPNEVSSENEKNFIFQTDTTTRVEGEVENA
jgi:hypothetical protein